MRKLYSAYSHCNAGCKYCFTKWNGVYSEQPLFGVEHLCEKEAVVYPCCDGEFFDQHNYLGIAKSMMENMDKIYFSISTKGVVDDQRLEALVELNKLLSSQNKGFVKFSVSISNKSRIEEIEPGTIPYLDRLEIAKRITNAGIPSSVTLKPILPFISNKEYYEIIEDFSKVTNRVLVGGLYVCPNTKFYQDYIKEQYPTERREVRWLTNKPIWEYVSVPQKIDQIKQFATSLGLQSFDSDIDVVKSYLRDRT